MSQLDEKLLVLYIAAMTVTIICRIILRYATLRLRSGAGYEAICEKRISLGSHLKRASMGFFSKKNKGDLISTITSYAAFLEIEGIGVIEKAATGIPSLIIGLIFLFCVDYRVFIFSVLLLMPAWYAYRHLASTQDRLNINRQKLIGTVTEETVEFIHGIHILKSCQTEKQHQTKIMRIFENLRDESIRNELSHLFPMSLFQFWFRAITVGTIFLAGMFFLLNGIDFMRLFLLTLSSFALFQGIEGMGIFSIFAKMTAQSLERMDMIDNIPVMSDISGEGGSTLSGGEKQRIAIARALIKDAPIVLLDEVTANIDVENEVKIQSALQKLLKNKTVIMIAHKLSTIQDADQILVIEDGSISRKGTHNELMKQIGLYKKLWDMQYQTEKWKI